MYRPVHRGFTLVELLVVVAIVGLLAALTVPAVMQARAAARRTKCQNNLHQIGLGLLNYHESFRALPPGWVVSVNADGRLDPQRGPGWSWASLILEHIEQRTLCDQALSHRFAVADPRHAKARLMQIPLYRCPADSREAVVKVAQGPSPSLFDAVAAAPLLACVGCGGGPLLPTAAGAPVDQLAGTNYVASFGTLTIENAVALSGGAGIRGDGPFFENSGTRLADITDGLSQTFLIGERSSRLGDSTWVGLVASRPQDVARVVGVADRTPNDRAAGPSHFGSEHDGASYFALADGSVLPVADTSDRSIFGAFATASAGDGATAD